MVKISSVEKGSLAYEKGIKDGENLVSINKNKITDVLDYRFYCTERKLKIVIEDKNGKQRKVKIKKDEYDDIGLEFETYLMDKQRSCRNKCIFCFIDQMPPNMRETLYFKDDDARLSFLFGNYITLTNVSDEEIDRIIKMHITPINISVHTTNPELRCKMMNNRFAGDALKYMYRLCENGIKINCQLVLVPGYNDGDELKKTLADLEKLYPNVESVAAVPVGLTKFREGLAKITPFNKDTAKAVIDTMNEFGDRCFEKYGDRLFYPSDEFYNLAQLPMPKENYYGEMLQLENGVGMSALLKGKFIRALEDESRTPKGEKLTIATGKGAYKLIKSLVDLAEIKWHNIDCEVVPIENYYFGELITTTGLITGSDLIKNLKGKENLSKVLISGAMLRNEGDIFLDDLSPDDVEKEIGAEIKVIDCDGAALLDALLDID
ncbi:MAG: DUF512 domain-containing protein [Acutalibacteraceae bacterium]|nr:DUF512 domain-containing protein [Acutalibacteraceae bacterium]